MGLTLCEADTSWSNALDIATPCVLEQVTALREK